MPENRIFASVGRGVYRLPFQLPNGHWRMVAVARSGRVVDQADYSDQESYEIARRELWRALREQDPRMLRAI